MIVIEEIFIQLSLRIVNFCLNLTHFATHLSYIFMCGSGSVLGIRIRIQKAPEYGSNTDPDPQHCLEIITFVWWQPTTFNFHFLKVRVGCGWWMEVQS